MPDLASARYPLANPEDLLNGGLQQLGAMTGAPLPIRTSIDRRSLTTDVAAALTTQVITAVAVPLQVGDIITNIAVQFGATAGATMTNWWFALYDTSATPKLLAQTADQTNGAIAANAVKDLPLTTAQTITVPGIYYVAIMVKAATVPSLVCAVLPTAAAAGAQLTGQKVLAQTSGTALTTTAPATLATPTTVVNVPLVICH